MGPGYLVEQLDGTLYVGATEPVRQRVVAGQDLSRPVLWTRRLFRVPGRIMSLLVSGVGSADQIDICASFLQ
jgi:hypothetical protein